MINKHIFLFSLLALIGQAVSCNQPAATGSLAEQTHQRRSEMLAEAQQCLSNAEKAAYVTRATSALDDAALAYQTEMHQTLPADAIDPYETERASFAAWYAYQQTIAEDVIGDLWELYSGGSAGGSFQVIHLYDIANANATEQELQNAALARKSFPEKCHENASFQQIDSTKAQLCLEFSNLYSHHQDIGPDGWPAVKHTPEQMEALLDADIDLFQKWMIARDALESLLDKDIRDLYASHTAYWKYVFQKEYQERFIGE